MIKEELHITVFEHESLRIDKGEQRLTLSQLKTLQQFYGEKGVPYYSLIHRGILFNGYVGVIQVGKTVIEVLPKADRSEGSNEETKTEWRNMLISMLRVVGIFDIHAPSSSDLRLRHDSILDIYFELFIKALESLIHKGL